MSDTTQQYEGRLYTQVEVDRMVQEAYITADEFWIEVGQDIGLVVVDVIREHLAEMVLDEPKQTSII